MSGNRQLAEQFENYRLRLRHCVDMRLDDRVRGRLDPSDVLQEAFIDLVAKYPRFQENQSMPVFVWMRLVTLEKLIQLHRRHLDTDKRNAGREVSIDLECSGQVTTRHLARQLIASQTTQVRQLIRNETRSELYKALDQIDAMDREIIFLRNFEELSNEEAAAVLCLSKTAASNRYIRALRRLKAILESSPTLRGFSKPH